MNKITWDYLWRQGCGQNREKPHAAWGEFFCLRKLVKDIQRRALLNSIKLILKICGSSYKYMYKFTFKIRTWISYMHVQISGQSFGKLLMLDVICLWKFLIYLASHPWNFPTIRKTTIMQISSVWGVKRWEQTLQHFNSPHVRRHSFAFISLRWPIEFFFICSLFNKHTS